MASSPSRRLTLCDIMLQYMVWLSLGCRLIHVLRRAASSCGLRQGDWIKSGPLNGRGWKAVRDIGGSHLSNTTCLAQACPRIYIYIYIYLIVSVIILIDRIIGILISMICTAIITYCYYYTRRQQYLSQQYPPPPLDYECTRVVTVTASRRFCLRRGRRGGINKEM